MQWSMLEDGLLDGLVCSTSCTNLPLLMLACDSATQMRCLLTGLTLKAVVEDSGLEKTEIGGRFGFPMD